ncbi:ComF family protein [Lewinella aquimaris]|uniref:ComF family protein n=1 Tax=Neolewinella aquimaris TaxID=1835722 RepID=A0A840E032_9BACT|nr:ComF family protein [Neolewinella aquimaris]MBB4078591.1 ComF family protein [Neolewinella aquimaris]
MGISHWVRGLTSLFFPNVCLNCSRSVDDSTALLCLRCESDLPVTDHWKQPENEVRDRLAGRLPLEYAAAAYTFREGNVCQQLIHAMKYQNRPDVGKKLGERLGHLLSTADRLNDLHGIVPVPIHNRRRHERGYNQAEAIAEGIGAILNKPVFSDALRRTDFQGSQTRRTKLERLENVRDSFVAGRGKFSNQHLLLVDDVLTTGATLDFSGNALLEAHSGLRLSVATLAIVER